MTTLFYNNAASGNPTNTYEIPEFLKAADYIQVLDKVGVINKRVPKNKNENVSFTRAVTPDVDTTESPEGVSKSSRAITFENESVTLQEFAESFAYSSRQRDMGEKDILLACKGRLTDLVGRTREVNAFNTYRNCNNVLYNSAAITSRATVNGFLTAGRLQLGSRFLQANLASTISEGSKGSTNSNTYPVEPAYVLLTHTDAISDFRLLPNWTNAAAAGGMKEHLPQVKGYIEDIVVIASPHFAPRLAAGAAIGATAMKSVGGVNVDVYTSILYGKDAFGRVSLAGSQSDGGMGGLTFTVLAEPTKSDPDNRITVVGVQWSDGPIVLNENFVIAFEHGVTSTPV